MLCVMVCMHRSALHHCRRFQACQADDNGLAITRVAQLSGCIERCADGVASWLADGSTQVESQFVALAHATVTHQLTETEQQAQLHLHYVDKLKWPARICDCSTL